MESVVVLQLQKQFQFRDGMNKYTGIEKVSVEWKWQLWKKYYGSVKVAQVQR